MRRLRALATGSAITDDYIDQQVSPSPATSASGIGQPRCHLATETSHRFAAYLDGDLNHESLMVTLTTCDISRTYSAPVATGRPVQLRH
jgi:hypothetical protein